MPLPRSKTASSISEIIGAPQDLPATILPTCRHVLQCFNLVFSEEKVKHDGQNPSEKDVALAVAKRVKALWDRASIPTIDLYNQRDRIIIEHKKVQALNKSYKRDKNTDRGKAKIQNLMLDLDRLFDVCPCKCENYSRCECSVNVPFLERDFLQDQRGDRLMRMEGVDVHTARRLKKKMARKAEENQREKRRKLPNEAIPSTSKSDHEVESVPSRKGDNSGDDDEEFTTRASTSAPKKTDQCRLRLEQFAITCDKVGVSDVAASHLASALLADLDKSLKEENKVKIVCDSKKVNRERSKVRKTLREEQLTTGMAVCGLYFDGRNDETKVLGLGTDGKEHQSTKKEHHISLISEPNSSYLGHVNVTEKGADGIARAIQEFLVQQKVNLPTIRTIGTDGENTNTGPRNGVIMKMETFLEHAVHWVICQLHSNELPLRHMIDAIDGKTTGPTGLAGPIGRRLADCETRPVAEFKPIEADLPNINIDDINLSRDQLYLYRISKAISSGECPVDLAAWKPGKLHHARWLTKASRILREYVTHKEPSKNLTTLATFIMRVYVPMWFVIRSNQRITDAPKNLWLATVKVRYLEKRYKNIVLPVIQNNSYAAHPENLLLAMLVDERKEVRETAVSRISSARERARHDAAVRLFEKPVLNFEANDYTELIDWDSTVIYEPPITKHLTNDELVALGMADTEVLRRIDDYLRLPCHTQAVERCVKEVTIESGRVFRPDVRDGRIRARLEERALNPNFKTKSQFKAL